MTVAKMNIRRQGTKGFRMNTSETELPEQLHGHLKENSRGLIFEIRHARGRSKKGGKGQ